MYRMPERKTVFFASCAIPAVQVGQQYDSFDFGTPLDTVDTVDAECLSGIVDTLCQAVSRVMSLDTPSMRAKAHFENNWKEFTYTQDTANRIPFGIITGKASGNSWCSGKACGSDPQCSKPAGGALSVPHEVVWPERAVSGQLLFYR